MVIIAVLVAAGMDQGLQRYSATDTSTYVESASFVSCRLAETWYKEGSLSTCERLFQTLHDHTSCREGFGDVPPLSGTPPPN